jgi:hypothetical protein
MITLVLVVIADIFLLCGFILSWKQWRLDELDFTPTIMFIISIVLNLIAMSLQQ